MDDDVIEVPEAAKILGIDEATVRHHAREKNLPSHLAGKKVYQFKRSEVLAFKAKPRKPGNPGKPGRTLVKVRYLDELLAEFKSEVELTGIDRDTAHAEALQLWIDESRRKRRKKK